VRQLARHPELLSDAVESGHSQIILVRNEEKKFFHLGKYELIDLNI